MSFKFLKQSKKNETDTKVVFNNNNDNNNNNDYSDNKTCHWSSVSVPVDKSPYRLP